MTGPSWTPEDVELVAEWFRRFFGASSIRRRDRGHAAEILAALAEAGRLREPGRFKKRSQWAMWRASVYDGESVGIAHNDREPVERSIRRYLASELAYPREAKLMRRELREWPDGSFWVGPWLHVEATDTPTTEDLQETPK